MTALSTLSNLGSSTSISDTAQSIGLNLRYCLQCMGKQKELQSWKELAQEKERARFRQENCCKKQQAKAASLLGLKACPCSSSATAAAAAAAAANHPSGPKCRSLQPKLQPKLQPQHAWPEVQVSATAAATQRWEVASGRWQMANGPDIQRPAHLRLRKNPAQPHQQQQHHQQQQLTPSAKMRGWLLLLSCTGMLLHGVAKVVTMHRSDNAQK